MAHSKSDENAPFIIRQPHVDDGSGIWRVVKESGSLDPNSSYLYLLLAKDFSDTCVVAESDGEIVGFVSGYRPPMRREVAFLWQVGLLPSMQGRGLGKRLVLGFLGSLGARGATVLETTVAPSNTASRALFLAIARQLGAECHVSPCFSAHMFPEGGHEDEELYRIGPLPQPANSRRPLDLHD
ncbi:MAG: diaminobutyrate acetyltransferase [Nitrococcus sp.]|nr:diaminobutyrate acetyltransferase [Nitrococcus sp.]